MKSVCCVCKLPIEFTKSEWLKALKAFNNQKIHPVHDECYEKAQEFIKYYRTLQ